LERLNHWLGDTNKTQILAKAEFCNPGGSVKDRPALNMVKEGIREGKLTRDKIIMDSSSGNTGVAYAMIGAAMGYQVELVIPENAGEKRRIAETFGARVVLSDAMEGSDGAIVEAQARFKKNPDRYFMPDQYNNPNNWKAHYQTTAMEIWKRTEGKITHFVAGIGTSGTLMGTGRRLKELNPKIEVIAVEPAESPVLSGGDPGPHKIQGIGAGFVPAILQRDLIDEVICVSSNDALEMGRALAKEEGLLVGISSGAAMVAAIEVARRPENKGKLIAVIIPSYGERYLSSLLFETYRKEALALTPVLA